MMLLSVVAFSWIVEHLLDENHLRHLQTIQKEAADGVAAFSPRDLISLYVTTFPRHEELSKPQTPTILVPAAFIFMLKDVSLRPWPEIIGIIIQNYGDSLLYRRRGVACSPRRRVADLDIGTSAPRGSSRAERRPAVPPSPDRSWFFPRGGQALTIYP
jgi:hypothetical protein